MAMIGDLQAAIDIVTEWQHSFRDSSSSATVSSEAVDASSWQKSWQEAAEAKDAGNKLFRHGDFTGDCSFIHYESVLTSCVAKLCGCFWFAWDAKVLCNYG